MNAPARSSETSGSVNRIGRRKNTPVRKAIGIEKTIALGTSTEGLCTSSHMEATKEDIENDLVSKSSIERSFVRSLIPIAAYTYAVKAVKLQILHRYRSAD